MSEDGSAAGAGKKRRMLGTTWLLGTTRRRRAAVGALGAVVVLGAFGGGALIRSAVSGPVPLASASDTSSLVGVSCVSSRFCMAVGYHGRGAGHGARTLAESWDGARWSVVASANLAEIGDQLIGVSCVSSRFCVAVGSDRTSTQGTRRRALIESWDGARWTMMASPATSAAGDQILYGVSCPSGSFCTAVGQYRSAATSGIRALAESWDGARWMIDAVPGPSASTAGTFRSVSCVSGIACTAAGNYTSGSGSAQPLVESWDGTRWSIDVTPGLPAGDNASVDGVSCAGSGFCVTTGFLESMNAGHRTQPLVESWDGTRWSVAATPQVVGVAQLYGVSCTGSAGCTAAGWYHRGTAALLPLAGSLQPLVESWDGARWSVGTGTGISGSSNLFSVSCVPGFCATVGYGGGARHARPVTELWNGARWSAAPAPSG